MRSIQSDRPYNAAKSKVLAPLAESHFTADGGERTLRGFRHAFDRLRPMLRFIGPRS
jgi:hypothetical protein